MIIANVETLHTSDGMSVANARTKLNKLCGRCLALRVTDSLIIHKRLCVSGLDDLSKLISKYSNKNRLYIN